MKLSRRVRHFFKANGAPLGIILTALVLFGAGGGVIWAATLKLPDFRAFEERKRAQSTKIYDRTGEVLLYDVYRDVKRTLVPIDKISKNAQNATIAIEDTDFYEHKGIKPTAILRALYANIKEGGLAQGGSTITQQVIKLTLLTKDKRLARKAKEAVLALKLEQTLPKEKILELYFNESPYGGNIYGIEEASQAFFHKPASDVTIAEAAYLAAIPNAPTYFSPYGKNRDKLDTRKNLVLARMQELGLISQEEYSTAINEVVTFQPYSAGAIKAPHFVFYVIDELKERYGEEAVLNDGFRVITTLDWKLQEKAEQVVARRAPEIDKNFNAKNMAAVGIDPKTGHILMMVGSRDYFDKENDGNFNIALAKRQPGSSFKPFVYASAFEKGYTPETVVFDVPTQFDTNCTAEGRPVINANPGSSCYTPENYDLKYRGPISLRNALAQSVNIPAIKVLYLTGLTDALKTARALGVKSLTDVNRYGLTLVLGGGEVTLLEMTGAYGTFAADGIRHEPKAILRIEDRNKNVLDEFTLEEERAIDPNIARHINDILSDNAARAPAFGENNLLNVAGRDVAVKTGTTNNYRDVWIIGYTPTIAVGMWAGNNDNTSMERRVAGLIIAPIWNEYMRQILPEIPEEAFTPPARAENYASLPPLLQGDWRGGSNELHSELYWINRRNPLGPPPINPDLDPQYKLWEPAVREWAAGQTFSDTFAASSTVPGQNSGVNPTVLILSPSQGQIVARGSQTTISITTTGLHPITQVDYFVNDRYIGSSKTAPHSYSFIPDTVSGLSSNNKLRIVAFDTLGNRGEAHGTLNVQ